MTDYLEKLLQGSGEVLEEARRRLEELLFPLPSAALTQNQEERNATPPQSGRPPVPSPDFQAGEMTPPELPGEERASPSAAEQTVAEEASGLPLLGVVPEDPKVVLAAGHGVPLVLYARRGAVRAYLNIAKRLLGQKVPLMKN